MDLTIVWNVWNNYEDVLLGSEIAYNQNKEKNIFDNLYLVSQGGYSEPPNENEKQYLDAYYNVEIDESHPLIQTHVKYKGVFRVLNGLKKSYEYGLKNNSDYVVMTNGDAWILDIYKLKNLLDREDIEKSAISARIGPCVGQYQNYGDFVPFFDDHFMIINVKKCFEHNVFDYDIPKAYNANFLSYGGIHYILLAMMDELVPDGLFNIYTFVEESINHYGEKSGFSLLPWQYQKDTSFLHANCAQEPYLNNLRAAQLEVLQLDKYSESKKYCSKYKNRENIITDNKEKVVYFRKNILEKLEYIFIKYSTKFKYFLVNCIFHKQKLKYLKGEGKYFKLYENILPITFVSRKFKDR